MYDFVFGRKINSGKNKGKNLAGSTISGLNNYICKFFNGIYEDIKNLNVPEK